MEPKTFRNYLSSFLYAHNNALIICKYKRKDVSLLR